MRKSRFKKVYKGSKKIPPVSTPPILNFYTLLALFFCSSACAYVFGLYQHQKKLLNAKMCG
ncbi:MAG: hypothetical protein EBS17_07760 [Flavobacteriia bacterium]|nr:hypothetical protein [Flavobacteriia bacterium]